MLARHTLRLTGAAHIFGANALFVSSALFALLFRF
jgi:hypothetical protein